MAIAVVCACLMGNAATALAAPGDLDPSFGSGGIGRVGSGYGQSVASRSDGGVAIFGSEEGPVGPPSDQRGGTRFAVGQLTPAGFPDTQFGGNGSVTTDFSSSSIHRSAFTYNGFIQPDGKVVAVGWAFNPSAGNGGGYFALARYNPDGSLDTSFGTGGKVLVKPDPRTGASALDAILQPDGKIVVTGYASDPDAEYATDHSLFSLVRLTSNGNLDTTFGGGDGIVLTDFGRNEAAASFRIAFAPNGSIVASGLSENTDRNSPDQGRQRFAIARYTPDGAPDQTFSDDGQTVVTNTESDSEPWGLTVDKDGKITVAGRGYTGSRNVFSLVRLTASGALDSGFDGDGRLTTALGSFSEPTGLVLEPSGKVVASGVVDASPNPANGTGRGWALARYLPDGRLDPSFGKDGTGTVTGGAFVGGRLTKDADGRLIMGGSFPLVAARLLDDEAKIIAPRPTSYVALGDSVSAGEGIGYDWQWLPGNDGSIGSYRLVSTGRRAMGYDLCSTALPPNSASSAASRRVDIVRVITAPRVHRLHRFQRNPQEQV